MKPSEVLRAAKAKISTPETWIKGAFARTADGVGLTYGFAPSAVCWCSLGAMEAVSKAKSFDLDYGVLDALLDALLVALDGADVASWNDAPERTHADVMAAFDRAAMLAEEKERAAEVLAEVDRGSPEAE